MNNTASVNALFASHDDNLKTAVWYSYAGHAVSVTEKNTQNISLCFASVVKFWSCCVCHLHEWGLVTECLRDRLQVNTHWRSRALDFRQLCCTYKCHGTYVNAPVPVPYLFYVCLWHVGGIFFFFFLIVFSVNLCACAHTDSHMQVCLCALHYLCSEKSHDTPHPPPALLWAVSEHTLCWGSEGSLQGLSLPPRGSLSVTLSLLFLFI